MADKWAAISTAELSRRLGMPGKTVRNRMVRMEEAGIVVREGQRGGWMMSIEDDWMGPPGEEGQDDDGP